MTRERGILMSGPMVRALLAGKKSQTRRVITPQPTVDARQGFAWRGAAYGVRTLSEGGGPYLGEFLKRCPFGVRGDRLWVRETFIGPWDAPDETQAGGPRYIYRADVQSVHGGKPGLAWKPSIHMPRAAARILLEVTDVRVQRVQEVSEEDAIAEGSCIRHGFDEEHRALAPLAGEGPTHYQPLRHCDMSTPIACFAGAWDGLNAKRGFGWAANPWVWALTFKLVLP